MRSNSTACIVGATLAVALPVAMLTDEVEARKATRWGIMVDPNYPIGVLN
ncbi:MAG: hypothetical protein JO202_12500 [Ktedonobacteraceae bacterium]|nr:hypothetical protein [Ktedonobacteraceae bacterium]